MALLLSRLTLLFLLFFFTDSATTEIYTLSLHDALPICFVSFANWAAISPALFVNSFTSITTRSEEHTSELQSLRHLVCRLLLEKKKRATSATTPPPTSSSPPSSSSPRRRPALISEDITT